MKCLIYGVTPAVKLALTGRPSTLLSTTVFGTVAGAQRPEG